MQSLRLIWEARSTWWLCKFWWSLWWKSSSQSRWRRGRNSDFNYVLQRPQSVHINLSWCQVAGRHESSVSEEDTDKAPIVRDRFLEKGLEQDWKRTGHCWITFNIKPMMDDQRFYFLFKFCNVRNCWLFVNRHESMRVRYQAWRWCRRICVVFTELVGGCKKWRRN